VPAFHLAFLARVLILCIPSASSMMILMEAMIWRAMGGDTDMG